MTPFRLGDWIGWCGQPTFCQSPQFLVMNALSFGKIWTT